MNPLTIPPDRLRRLRAICLSMPESSEKETWGDPTWRVRAQIFAMQKGNYEGGRPSVWLKAPKGIQGPLVRSDPQRFFVPGYVGRKGWIGVFLDGPSVDWEAVRNLIHVSYKLIAPRQLGARLG